MVKLTFILCCIIFCLFVISTRHLPVIRHFGISAILEFPPFFPQLANHNLVLQNRPLTTVMTDDADAGAGGGSPCLPCRLFFFLRLLLPKIRRKGREGAHRSLSRSTTDFYLIFQCLKFYFLPTFFHVHGISSRTYTQEFCKKL